MSQFQLFARLAKVDVEKRQVTGVIASEVPDAANEVFDYEASKPNFESWSGSVAKMSGGKSVGNVRAMHGQVAAGLLSSLVLDDLSKSVEVVADIVDDNEWDKVQKGVYTGFSIGGKYGRKWQDPMNKSLKRYEAKPSEVSLVDLPCNPEATFTMVKADGMEEQVKFVVPDEAELMQKMLAATDPAEKRELFKRIADRNGLRIVSNDEPGDDEEELQKSAWSINELARTAESCSFLMECYGCNIDGSVKPFSDNVKKAAGLLYDALLQMVSEEVAAAKERLKGIKKQMDDEAELAKSTISEDLQKRMDTAQAEHDTLAKVFTALKGEGDAAPEQVLEALNKFVAAHDELTKSLATESDKLAKALAEVEVLKSKAAPAIGAKAVVVGKEGDGLRKAADPAKEEVEGEQPSTLELMKRAQARPIGIGFREPSVGG